MQSNRSDEPTELLQGNIQRHGFNTLLTPKLDTGFLICHLWGKRSWVIYYEATPLLIVYVQEL